MAEPSQFVTPGQLRLLELQQEELVQNSAKIQGLFQYLNFLDDSAFDRCLGRSGKSPDCLSRAPDGGPTPRHYANITSVSHSKRMRQQEASRHNMLGWQRKEPASLNPEDVWKRLREAFLAYTDPMLYAREGVREMNIVGFLRLLRDSRLLDNKVTLMVADTIFNKVVHGPPPPPTAGSEGAGVGGRPSCSGAAAGPGSSGAAGAGGGGGGVGVGWAGGGSQQRPVVAMAPSAGPGGWGRPATVDNAVRGGRRPTLDDDDDEPVPVSRPCRPSLTGDMKDAYVDYERFKRCLRGVVRIKFPKTRDPDKAVLLMAKKWIVPFARDVGAGGGVGASVDGLYARGTMDLVRQYDVQLKRLFAWYSSMDETDPARVLWPWVRDHASSINSSQFVLMLLNFNVLPVLLSKGCALEVFARCEEANDGDEKADAMYFPTFLETLAEVALSVGHSAADRIRSCTSPDELKMLKRYVDGCPPPHGHTLQEVYQEVMASRGRDAQSLDQAPSYDSEAVKQRNAEQAAREQRKAAEEQTMGVVERREEMRQRFALTRLRNFYKDVRTVSNNTTWPPERDASPTARRSGPGMGGHAGPGHGRSEEGEGEGVHVAFFDSERAIKTPKPVWIPVGHNNTHVPNSKRFSVNNAYAGGPESPGASNPSAAAGGAGTVLSGPTGHMLLLDTPHAAGAAAAAAAAAAAGQHLHLSFAAAGSKSFASGAGPSSPGALQNYLRTPKGPKQFQLKVSIEDRDEHEAILNLAGRLPYIRVPSVTPGRGLEGELTSSPSGGLDGERPRAVTAPAEMRRRAQGKGSAQEGAAAVAAAGSGSVGGATEPGLEASSNTLGVDPSVLSVLGVRGDMAAEASGALDELQAAATGRESPVARRRLPSVAHQLHRQHATAAAMASMAGPGAGAAAAAALHGTGALGSSPPSRAHTLPARHPSPPTLPPVVISLGPSPSQLSMLGLIPSTHSVGVAPGSGGGYSPNSSMRKGKSRQRPPPGGLPNLPLADKGPSREVLEQLAALDRFDGQGHGLAPHGGHRHH